MNVHAAAVIVVLSATSAFAQGYEVRAESAPYEAPPATAVMLDVDCTRADKASTVAYLPFEFAYYGRRSVTMVVSAHGWTLPGVARGFAAADDPTADHGQDKTSGAFPYRGDADGVVAPLWTRLRFVGDGPHVRAWTVGVAPERRFVVAWENVAIGDGPTTSFEAQFHEGAGRIVFAYATNADAPPSAVRGIDEPGGARFVVPPPGATANVAFEPRVAALAGPLASRPIAPVAWEHVKRESLSGEGAQTACYVAKGRLWYVAPDRVLAAPGRKSALLDEDRAAFGGAGDAERFVRHVLDGKAVLLPADGGAAVRLWFRVIEFYEIDDAGFAGADEHVWNLRRMLSAAFPENDPRAKIDHYCAWRGMVASRLAVVKLFDFAKKDDSARQFTTGRGNDYALWCMRLKEGVRGALPDFATPGAGWLRFAMKADDANMIQHADKSDLRCVPDPNYVDSFYDYTVRSDDGTGWEWWSKTRPAAAVDEPFDMDPAPAGGTSTPK